MGSRFGADVTRTVPAYDLFEAAVKSACENVIQAEPEITQFDTSMFLVLCSNTENADYESL